MLKLGIDRIDSYKNLFDGKKVGLITNPTGVDSNLRLTSEILKEKVNLISLYAPEHGIRGDQEAGAHIQSYFDEKLQLTVHSLYGKNKKPSPEILEGVDVLCYDMQDVGLRFYTYIYTMAYSMIAAKENNIKFVVFDRPNPLGDKVEGNLLDLNYRSFVGYYSIPQRYGLTVGELALLFNTEFDINCDLEVIPMENYDYKKEYKAYNLPWLSPSPNLPTLDSAFVYGATCYYEGTNVSEGRGTTRPFQLIGAPFIDADDLCEKVRALNLPGIKVRPAHFTPSFSKHQGQTCHGIEIFLTDKEKFIPVRSGYQIFNIIRTYEGFEFLKPFKEGLNPMINLLTGGEDVKNGTPLDEIFKQFEKDEHTFTTMKKRYHLYE